MYMLVHLISEHNSNNNNSNNIYLSMPEFSRGARDPRRSAGDITPDKLNMFMFIRPLLILRVKNIARNMLI